MKYFKMSAYTLVLVDIKKEQHSGNIKCISDKKNNNVDTIFVTLCNIGIINLSLIN